MAEIRATFADLAQVYFQDWNVSTIAQVCLADAAVNILFREVHAHAHLYRMRVWADYVREQWADIPRALHLLNRIKRVPGEGGRGFCTHAAITKWRALTACSFITLRINSSCSGCKDSFGFFAAAKSFDDCMQLFHVQFHSVFTAEISQFISPETQLNALMTPGIAGKHY
jgi:hypothetical protein